jgi:hypothetical protein
MRCIRFLALATLVAACGSSAADDDDDDQVGFDAGVTVEEPGSYEDNLVQVSRMPGSTFVEIQEVTTRDDGTVFFCTGVQGLRVASLTASGGLQSGGQGRPSLGHGQYPRCQHVAVDGDVAYITSRGDEIQPTSFITAFDVSSQTVDELSARSYPGASLEGVAAANGRAYVAMHGDGLAVMEISGSSFEELGVATGLVNAWGVDVAGTTVYVADGAGGLAVVDVSNPASPSVVGQVDTGGAAQSVVVEGTTAFVGAGSAGLVVVDVSTPTDPRVIATADTPGSALQVAIDNGHAYVADWNDIRVFDVSDPSAPQLRATEVIQTGDDFSRVLGISAHDDYAIAGEWTGLYSFEFKPSVSAPDVAVAPLPIEFGNVAQGDADAVAVLVRNDGSERLVAYDIHVEGAAFDVDRNTLYLDPGERGIIEVTFRPGGSNQEVGQLVLESDDPDQAEYKVEMVGNRAGLGVGDPATNVTVRLLGGGEFRSSDAAGKVVVLAYFATF